MDIVRKSWRPGEFAARHGISPAFVYKQIAEGKLEARKAGNATIITDGAEQKWVAAMPVIGGTATGPKAA
jgi:hypothetical protein